MFKRRDLPPVLLLVVLIILVMLTLSQILVVHNGRYVKGSHSLRQLQMELRQMDLNLHSLMMQNVPSVELNRRQLQNQINANRVARIMAEAARPNDSTLARSGHRHHAADEVVMAARDQNQEDRIASSVYHSQDDVLESPHHTRELLHGQHYIDDIHTQAAQILPIPHPPNDSADGPPTVISPTRWHVPAGAMRTHEATRVSGPETRKTSGTVPVSSVRPSEYCPSVPPRLVGYENRDLNSSSRTTEEAIVRDNPEVSVGGWWRPLHCVARHKVAIVVPYRDRDEHLRILLSHLHPFLQRQQLDYHILVVEQRGQDTFNKARIMNIAFVEGMKLYPFECFVFHDVDLVPEDDRNMYSCPAQPRHMSVAIDEMGYKLAYPELVGGVLAMRSEHFQRLNGYSNLYWGWGAEDDDMAFRIMYVGLKITRPIEAVARYKMIKHTKRKPSDWRKRLKLLYTGTRRFQFDGLNSLEYLLVHIEQRPLFTHILADIGKPPRGFR